MIIGIDLGTTNSAAAIWRDGEAVLIPNALGDLLTPSAVGLGDDGALLVGMAARERQSTHPKDTATAFKRMMGSQAQVTLGKKRFSAEDLSALVLASLKRDAEAFLGEAVTGAVITVPAYFSDRQRKATRRAGELAGLKVERLINEPTAAALAYGIHERDEKSPFLVFDLGGGTFDVSIVEIFDGIIEVRASAGDNRLGGEDFNDVVAAIARDRITPERGWGKIDASALHELLRAAAERTRRGLSESPAAPFTLTIGEAQFATEIGEAEFEEKAAPLIERLRDPVLRSLRDSDTRAEALSEVILVGGATRMPVVRKAVTRMFGRFPATRVHPDHAVALGAAVQAGLKGKDAALSEVRLTDVCPYSLGVDVGERGPDGQVRSGIFQPIIERNTVVPASRSHSFSTMQNGQRQVEFNIFQGESRNTAENIKLGQVKVPVPPKPAGHVQIDCRFSYDASGLLEIDVTVPETGMTRQIVILDEEDAPSPAEIEKRRAALAALKLHPREDSANAAVLARAARCFQSFLGDQRLYIGQLISGFEAALDTQDPRQIEPARDQVGAALDALEGDRFL